MHASLPLARPRERVIAFAASLLIGAVALASPVAAGMALSGALSRPSDASRYGDAVAVDETGDIVVVGAPGIGSGSAPGRAFVYGRVGGQFSLLATLKSADDVAKNGFGTSVAVQGDKVVVGAGNAFSIPGRAYVFIRPAGGWSGTLTETATLAPSTTALGGFGRAVGLDGGVIAVGDGQKVFVFTEPAGGWTGSLTPAATLPSPTVVTTGMTVAIDGDVIVAGNPDTLSHRDAYVYVRPAGGWSGTVAASATLDVSTDPRGFGAVGIDGTTIVVGASVVPNGSALSQGAAFVYTRPAGGWAGTLAPSATLRASDGGSFDEFGTSVAIDGSTIAVGNNSGATDGTQNDGAYLFVEPAGGWSGDVSEATAVHPGPAAAFGNAVALRNGTLVVGDPIATLNFNFQGAAYAYLTDSDDDRIADVADNCPDDMNRDQADIDTDGAGDACDADDDGDAVDDSADNCPRTSNGDQADLDADGAGDACDPDDDADTVTDGADNCPALANPDQADLDADGAGDACDPDDDGDAVADGLDNCPALANGNQYDLDADGLGDRCDNANAVSIDVAPGITPNAVRTSGKLVAVAILSSATFDATGRINPVTLRFGRLGTEAPVIGACRAGDVNLDGLADLTCDFEVRRTGLGARDATAALSGSTAGAEATTVRGTDTVTLTKPR